METVSAQNTRAADELPVDSRPLRIKLVPPRLPAGYVERRELEALIERAPERRVTSIIAGAGFGKSTSVAACALRRGWAWYTVDAGDASPVAFARGLVDALRRKVPALGAGVVTVPAGANRATGDSLAAALAHAADDVLDDDLVLVVDDVHELGADVGGARLLEGLVRNAPPELHLVLCSRDELPFALARLRGRGEVEELTASQLAFTVDEVAELLREGVGEDASHLAGALHEASGGWPAAVQLARAFLGRLAKDDRATAASALGSRRGPLYGYLADEVMSEEAPPVRRVLQIAAEFGHASPELCGALGVDDAELLLEGLVRRGLLAGPPLGSDGWYTAHALIRQFVRESWPLEDDQKVVCRAAGAWFERNGLLRESLSAYTAAQDADAIARLLAERCQELLDSAAFDAVFAAADVLPPELRRGPTAFLVAHAHILRSEYEEAERWLGAVDPDGSEPALRFFAALIQIDTGNVREALDIFHSAEKLPGAPEHAFAKAFAGTSLLQLGRVEEARRYAGVALDAAGAPGQEAARVEATMLYGDLALADGELVRAERHMREAVELAEEIGNVLALCSARTRLAHALAALGKYRQAVTAATAAMELADAIGFALFRAWAPTSRGYIQLEVGDFDEALSDLTLAAGMYERMRSKALDFALVGVGDVHRARGETAQAQGAYERALRISKETGKVQVRAGALIGLALLANDREEADLLVQEAIGLGVGEIAVRVRIAAGWLAARGAEWDTANEHAAIARDESRTRAQSPLIAEALALSAAVSGETAPLDEAAGIWERLENPFAHARALVAIAEVRPGLVAPAELEAAQRLLRSRGVRNVPLHAAPLVIRTLGGFAVVRDGEPAGVTEWQSKKARDLLKLLVVRRGHRTPRDWFVEILWPDDDPAKTANRLAVALNVVRKVLDPERRFPTDHFVDGDANGIRLAVETLSVDVEEFLARARAALQKHAEGPPVEARSPLEDAEGSYAGDFLEEDLYEDWPAALRDEARTAYVAVARALAGASSDPRYYRRILTLDPYDEEAHQSLVSLLAERGMHGEARRAYAAYVQRLDEIGVEPAGYAELSSARP